MKYDEPAHSARHDTLELMLNPFPIQYLSMVAYALLRLCVGVLFMRMGYQHLAARKTIPDLIKNSFPFFPFGRTALFMIVATELITGALFTLGFYTQIAAILSMAFCIKLLVWNKRLPANYFQNRTFYVLLFFASASLFITGAGFIAFDLPI